MKQGESLGAIEYLVLEVKPRAAAADEAAGGLVKVGGAGEPRRLKSREGESDCPTRFGSQAARGRPSAS